MLSARHQSGFNLPISILSLMVVYGVDIDTNESNVYDYMQLDSLV